MKRERHAANVKDMLREHIEARRIYASYWKSGANRQIEEQHVAAHLVAFLERFDKNWEGVTVASNEQDPPDCCGLLASGQRFGIEVTELVNQVSVERHELRRHAERRAGPTPRDTARPDDVALWTCDDLITRLTKIVAVKDKPFNGGPFSPYMVAIFSDEMMVTPALALDAVQKFSAETTYLDAAYLILSYDPGATDFPDRVPVFKVPVRRRNGDGA